MPDSPSAQPASDPLDMCADHVATGLPAQARRVALCVSPEMSLSSALIACAPMRAVNSLSGRTCYDIAVVGPSSEPVVSGIGIAVEPSVSFDEDAIFDMVVVVSAYDQTADYKKPLMRFLRRQAQHGAEICGIDMGVVLIAEAGLLTDYRAAVHWEVLDAVTDRFVSVDFCDDVYVIDRNRFSCGGHLACKDLFVAIIERHHGAKVAREVANDIQSGPLRPGDTRQSNPLSWDPTIRNPHLRQAVDIMQETIEEPMAIPHIADQVGISVRQLQNLSRQHFGETLSERYLAIRLNAARYMLMYGDMSVTEIAVATGFNSSAIFARAFRRRFNMTASQYRSDFRSSFSRPYFVSND